MGRCAAGTALCSAPSIIYLPFTFASAPGRAQGRSGWRGFGPHGAPRRALPHCTLAPLSAACSSLVGPRAGLGRQPSAARRRRRRRRRRRGGERPARSFARCGKGESGGDAELRSPPLQRAGTPSLGEEEEEEEVGGGGAEGRRGREARPEHPHARSPAPGQRRIGAPRRAPLCLPPPPALFPARRAGGGAGPRASVR